MTAYLWLLKYLIPFIMGGLLFGGAAWKIQGGRLDSCKATQQLCLSANIDNTKTIEMMKEEAKKADKSCSDRLISKDQTIKKLKEIDNMRGKDETNNDNSTDDIYNALNGMWDNK